MLLCSQTHFSFPSYKKLSTARSNQIGGNAATETVLLGKLKTYLCATGSGYLLPDVQQLKRRFIINKDMAKSTLKTACRKWGKRHVCVIITYCNKTNCAKKWKWGKFQRHIYLRYLKKCSAEVLKSNNQLKMVFIWSHVILKSGYTHVSFGLSLSDFYQYFD